jgi:hypothetical protein
MLQSEVPILWPWKSEPLHPRSKCRPRPYFHASTKAGLRIARPGLWTAVGIGTPLAGESPVLQYSHIRDVLIWKSGTSLARSSHAVSPRIPTSPQQTTTAAIYTYLFMYSVVVLAVWAAAPCGVGHPVCSLWSLTRGLVSASKLQVFRFAQDGATGIGGVLRQRVLKAVASLRPDCWELPHPSFRLEWGTRFSWVGFAPVCFWICGDQSPLFPEKLPTFPRHRRR